MLVLPRQIHDLRHFCLSHFVGVHAAYPDPSAVHVQHDPSSLLTRLLKKAFENVNDKFHRRVVVVQHENLIHGWLPRFWPRLDDDPGIRALGIAVPTTPVAVAHLSSASTCRDIPAAFGRSCPSGPPLGPRPTLCRSTNHIGRRRGYKRA